MGNPSVNVTPAAAGTTSVTSYRLQSKSINVKPSLTTEDIFAALFTDSSYGFWLDSSRIIPGFSRFSIMGDASGPLTEIIYYHLQDKRIDIQTKNGACVHHGDIFDYLKTSLASRSINVSSLPFGFALGYVGYFGYELKALCDGKIVHAADTPDAAFIFCDRALICDYETGQYYALCLVEEGRQTQESEWFAYLEDQLAKVEPRTTAKEKAASSVPIISFSSRHKEEEYHALIERCQEHIRAGDSYEICLTNQFTVAVPIQAFDTYCALRKVNPAPYAAYLRFDDLHILCSSPERFLAVDTQGWVESKPIKGTIRRGATPQEDEQLRAQLENSEKDRAENLMIVDLLRNDLSRVCDIGSVHVPKLFNVETYATVHQLVSTIRGKLRSDQSAIDCIRAAFPGGSMTGAPKRRTMDIIDKLEAGPRGIYSGALGWLSLNGAADMNIVIRTLVATPNHLSLGAGGAITIASDPCKEWEEALLKTDVIITTVSKSNEGSV